MILIFSSKTDITTNLVIDWLLFYNKKFMRYNEEIFSLESIKNSLYLKNNFSLINIKEVKSVWYRRSSFKMAKYSSNNHFDVFEALNKDIIRLEQYVNYLLSKKKSINKPYDDERINRLIVSGLAKNIGLNVPDFFLINSRKELRNEIKKNKLITKTISGSTMLYDFRTNETSNIYTNEIFETHINNLTYISYFEKKIEKKYELRVFFLENEFWTMAIMSQNDKQTILDFRRYNKVKENRAIPYKLPNSIKNKLIHLLNQLSLNSGSIDLIVTKDDDYIFLEVNPKGQFGMVSFPCNYNLEEKIAKYLIND